MAPDRGRSLRDRGPGSGGPDAASGAGPPLTPEGVLAELEAVLVSRRDGPAPPGSYSVNLLRNPTQAQRKIMEEAFELCLELGRPSPDPARTAEEAADVLFSVLAGLVGAGVELDAVLAELAARRR